MFSCYLASIHRDLSSQPAQITNNNGFILLRQGGVETTLVVGHGFLLTDGHTEVTVPDVLGTRDDYSLVCKYDIV